MASGGMDNTFVGDFKLTMWIPSELGGKVIGKKGVVIANLTIETKCDVIRALQPVGSSLWAAVVIMGEASRCFAAYKAIAALVFNEIDDVVLEFPFIRDRYQYKFLSGSPGMSIVKRVSAETDVRVLIPEGGNNTGRDPSRVFSLEGACENVYRALDLFKNAHKEHEFNRVGRQQNTEEYQQPSQESKEWGKKPTPITGVPSSSGPPPTSDIRQAKPTVDKRAPQPTPTPKEKKIIQKEINIENTDESSDNKSKKPVETPPPKITREINIPAYLVGLLLANRPVARMGMNSMNQQNVLNRIQRATGTVVSRTSKEPYRRGPKKGRFSGVPDGAVEGVEGDSKELSVAVGVNDEVPSDSRRRRSMSEDDSDDEEFEDALEEEEGEGEDERKEAIIDDKEDGDEENVPADIEKKGVSEVKDEQDLTPVGFIVAGYYDENIDAAVNSIEQIIQGDRIKDVLFALKEITATLKFHFGSSLRAESSRGSGPREERAGRPEGRGRGRGEGRGGRGRGGRSEGRGRFSTRAVDTQEGTASLEKTGEVAEGRKHLKLTPRMAKGVIGEKTKKTAGKKVSTSPAGEGPGPAI
mmetsp:Transcript_31507/g.30072  ORF Transcript_31507/g.30072 Transcript_31507/m.30072 type:complete len:583 (-) Transcript_31507:374-2122(-)